MSADKESVLPLTAVFIGAVTYSCLLYLSPHKSLQQAAQRGLLKENSHVFACRESLMVQLWMLLPPGFISTLLLWIYSSLPLSASLTFYLIEAYRMFQQTALHQKGDATLPQVAIMPVSQSGTKSRL